MHKHIHISSHGSACIVGTKFPVFLKTCQYLSRGGVRVQNWRCHWYLLIKIKGENLSLYANSGKISKLWVQFALLHLSHFTPALFILDLGSQAPKKETGGGVHSRKTWRKVFTLCVEKIQANYIMVSFLSFFYISNLYLKGILCTVLKETFFSKNQALYMKLS